QRASRLVAGGFIESVAPQASEPFAALENAERHAFLRRRAALEGGHRHEGRALASLQRFADRGSWLHALSIERGPASAAGPLLEVPDRTLFAVPTHAERTGVEVLREVQKESHRHRPEERMDLAGLPA